MHNIQAILKRLFPHSVFNISRTRGFSLIEILVSIGVFSTLVFATVGIFIVSQESVQIGRAKTKAVFHLKDYVEKIKNIKRYDWELLTSGTYIFTDNAGNWTLTPAATGETIDTYTRLVQVSDAYRNATGALTIGSGTVDPSSKFITVTVSWTGVKPGSISESFYITRYLDNLAWEIDYKVDFDAGTHSGTTTVTNDDGEVVLGAGGGASWCEPELVIAGVNLEGQGVAKAVTAIEGRAFASTGENASGWTFSDINITNGDPPVGTVLGYYNDGGVKGNDVFGETNYGYVAADHPSPDVIILNTSVIPHTVSGQFNIPDSPSDGRSVYVYGTTGYVTSGSKLWNFDVTSKTGTRPAIDTNGVTLNGTGTAVVVSGSYAYVATSSIDHQLQIIDLSTPSNLQIIGSVNLNAAGATDLYINNSETRAYIVTNTSATQREFFIIDITTKTNPILITDPVELSYDTNGMSPRGVEVVSGGKAIIVGTGGIEYQVINVSSETSAPTSCIASGGMNVDAGIYDSASILESDNDAFTYIMTGDANQEFRIIEGGPGGEFATSGVWESATFDAGNSAAFNRFDVTFEKPGLTDIRFQVAVVDPGGSGTCTDADFSNNNFYGPSGNSATFFQGDDAIPIDESGVGYENPGRCARIRAYLETAEYSQTPLLQDITVNYSP